MRIGTFNIENLDTKDNEYNPTLAERKPVLQAVLNRLNADILCLQEVHAQERPDHTSDRPSRDLSALEFVLQGTMYEDYHLAHTHTSSDTAYDKRNLVILSRYPIAEVHEYRHDLIEKLQYRKVTASPKETSKDISWERPILHTRIDHPQLRDLHVINLHLKSRLASNVSGQKDGYRWNSAAGWAEGYFLSSIKRVGQAIETRILVDKLLQEDPHARIVVCGDFNAEPGEVPVEAICGTVENTQNPDLRNQVLIPCSAGIPASVRYSHLHHGQTNLLDHMLISQGLLPCFQQARIFNENLHDESLPFAGDIKFPESDHAAFVGIFDIPATG